MRFAALIGLLTLIPLASAAEPKGTPVEPWEMGPFVKRDKPILSPTADSVFTCPILKKEVKWESQNVYNPAAVVRDGKVYLLYRADDTNKDLKWGRTCRIGLAISDDGVTFKRHGKPVVFPDNDDWKKYEWEGGCEDLHVVEGPDGVYYMNYTTWSGTSDTMSIGLATLRLDRFAGLGNWRSRRVGRVVTRPITATHPHLDVNVELLEATPLQVAVVDAEGTPLPGFGFDECQMNYDPRQVYTRVRWKHHADLTSLQGQPIRLAFRVSTALLYSYRFSPA